ncbi:MAG TPA: xanthine dehydrogenase family protein molybdopterin-binding subunit [Beijerinckiaceae bacterium]|nr:xanthine dehydrogenase family protein molybdopterin-binding subunit [Beijerinckiaceae bacterium]
MKPMKFGMGQAVRRVEDQRFITGSGHYATDYRPDGVTYAAFVRSPHAHATFAIRNVEAVRALKGVLLVLTPEDVAGLNPIPCQAILKNSDGSSMVRTPYAALAQGEVRHVGDTVAMVVAKSLAQAKDAAEALEIDWKAMPAAVGIKAAMKKGAPAVWAEVTGNIALDSHIGDKAKTDAAFARADRVVKLTIVNNRLVANYMEPRVCTAEYDTAKKRYTLTLGSQGSHGIRDTLAKILGEKSENIRVVTPDVGGGFGNKAFMYREYPLLAVAARKLKKPVTWTQERSEHFLTCAQGRDNIATAEMALSSSGRFLAMRVDLLADFGAYLSQYAPYIPFLGGTMTTGVYDIPAAHFRVRGIYTHTVPVDAYRGAGRPEAAYLIERLVDAIALETGRTPDRIRSINYIRPGRMPYATPVGRTYDSGDFEGVMRRAMEVSDWSGFRKRAAASKKRGRLRGIGLATYIEACGGGGAEPAYVALEKDGSITIRIGSQSNGQGHETAYAQLASQHLDLPLSKIRVLQGDTNQTPTGSGTGGSRSIPVGGAAVDVAAARLAENLRKIAADELESAPSDLEIADGRVRVAGTDRAIDFAGIARSRKATAELLNTTGSFAPPEATYPNGTHVCEVEIDPDTGSTQVLSYVIVDDFGVTLNPLLLAGQVHGGTIQGIGQALLENTVFTPEGQLLTASFMDYAMPRAADVPSLHFETRNVRCVTNSIGVKGAGEAGAIGSCPAVINAVVDALNRGFGIRHIDMPATPEKVFAAIRSAKAR